MIVFGCGALLGAVLVGLFLGSRGGDPAEPEGAGTSDVGPCAAAVPPLSSPGLQGAGARAEAAGSAGESTQDVPTPEATSGSFVRGGKPRWEEAPNRPAGVSAVRMLLRSCKGVAKGPAPSAMEVTAWLQSRDLSDVRRGIGWALRVEPPLAEELLAIARDESRGVHAAAALWALASDPDARGLLRTEIGAFVRARSSIVQRTALAALPYLGEEGHALALEIVRAGNASADVFMLLSDGVGVAQREALAAAALQTSPVDAGLARHVLARPDLPHSPGSALMDLVERLADTHPDPGVRDVASGVLVSAASTSGGTLRVMAAIYGASESYVDVTRVLQDRIEDDGLSAQAGNGLAGDPVPGVTKTLLIEFELGGRRFVRTMREGAHFQVR